MVLSHKIECSEIRNTEIRTSMSAPVIVPASNNSTSTTANPEGLQFEIHEVEEVENDDVPTRFYSSAPQQRQQPQQQQTQQQPQNDDDAGSDDGSDDGSDCSDCSDPEDASPFPLQRSTSGIDQEIQRVDFKDEATTVRILAFLETQGINTNALVQKHLVPHGSRCRIAIDDSGKIVGFLMFDNEIKQETLVGASKEEIETYINSRPFIFIQLLIVDPLAAASSDKKWSERLIASALECIVKNRKVAIVRTKADDEAEIQLYKSCGFYTMEDMSIPSYSSRKDNVAVLAYTPLGLEQTAAIFKQFYSSGARF